ncbi:MAG TPA: hypothetical protein VK525_11970 [Candidatus Saccharimonadales bacterium]|nr:hypothetical protein [Candidatus Saccharimonadales bacterium]
MDKSQYRHGKKWQPVAPPHTEGGIQYLLKAENQILHSISGRAPVPQILDQICIALDLQIGNMVSLISLPKEDASCLTEMARNASLFGLYIFATEAITAHNGGPLGRLEMYCCIPRNPSSREYRLIERAACLVGIALERDEQALQETNGGKSDNFLTRRSLLNWLVSMN